MQRPVENKKTWFCVTSTFDDRGRTTAAITASVESCEKPESTFTSTARRDVYTDWFDSLEKARAFLVGAKEESCNV